MDDALLLTLVDTEVDDKIKADNEENTDLAEDNTGVL